MKRIVFSPLTIIVLALILASLFLPAQQVIIEGIGKLSIGQEAAYASPDVETLRPEGEGNTTDLNHSPTDSPNWECVNDVTPDNDTTYVWCPQQWEKDTYATQNHSQGSGTINKVTIYIRARSSPDVGAKAKTVVRTHGQDYAGSEISLTASWANYSTEYLTNPDTGSAWTWSEVDALECGVMLQSSSSNKGRCTQVYIEVDYAPTYTLDITIVGNGSVTKDPDQPTYTYNTDVELTATADPGWTFDSWSGDLSGSTNPDTITMTGNKSVTASFAINTYTITVTQGANGTITPGTTTVDYGGSQTFNITPDTGYHIADVVVDGASQGAVSSYDFTNVTADHTITATFTQDQYTLTVNITGNGSVTKDPDQATYTYSDVVELTATADPGWTFDSWSGDLSGSTNPDTITMTGNKSVTATFTQDEYTLTVNIVGSGSVSKDPDQATYTYGDVVQLTATADPGWTFDSWSGDLSGSTNPDTITMDSDKTVTAAFTQDQYTLTVNITGNGSVTKDPDQATYTYGTVVQLTATADPGWTFDSWSGDLTGSTNPDTITMTGNKSVTATFTQAQQPVGGGGGGGAGPREYFTVDFLGEITKEPISSTGRLLNSLVASSPDGIHVLEMEKDTLTLSQDGEVIKLIKITEAETPRPPENIVIVGKVYDFEPSNITFSKPIRLTLGYNINELPENAISVALAYYTAESGWVKLEAESGVVAEIGKVTASVDHFTIFAVLAGVPPPPLLPPSPPPPAPPAPAAFELSNLSITPSFSKIWELLTFVVKTGEQVTITVDVTNYGGQEGNYDALLKINGVTQGNQEITFSGGQRQKIVFIVTESKPGSYTVEIGNLSGEFQSLLWFNWLLTGGLTAAFILLGWLAWYYWHYKKGRKTY